MADAKQMRHHNVVRLTVGLCVLQFATDCRTVCVGKPDPAFFEAALSDMGLTSDRVCCQPSLSRLIISQLVNNLVHTVFLCMCRSTTIFSWDLLLNTHFRVELLFSFGLINAIRGRKPIVNINYTRQVANYRRMNYYWMNTTKIVIAHSETR